MNRELQSALYIRHIAELHKLPETTYHELLRNVSIDDDYTKLIQQMKTYDIVCNHNKTIRELRTTLHDMITHTKLIHQYGRVLYESNTIKSQFKDDTSLTDILNTHMKVSLKVLSEKYNIEPEILVNDIRLYELYRVLHTEILKIGDVI